MPLCCEGEVREAGDAVRTATEELFEEAGPLPTTVEEEEEEASCAGRSKLLSPILSSSSRVERSSKQSWTAPDDPAGADVDELAMVVVDAAGAVREELLQTGSAMEEGLQLLSACGWPPCAPFS